MHSPDSLGRAPFSPPSAITLTTAISICDCSRLEKGWYGIAQSARPTTDAFLQCAALFFFQLHSSLPIFGYWVHSFRSAYGPQRGAEHKGGPPRSPSQIPEARGQLANCHFGFHFWGSTLEFRSGPLAQARGMRDRRCLRGLARVGADVGSIAWILDPHVLMDREHGVRDGSGWVRSQSGSVWSAWLFALLTDSSRRLSRDGG